MQKFTVIRQHFGDRLYQVGDTREALASDVAHLISTAVLAPYETKPAASIQNKAKARK
jgi:hypothetical protein